MKELYWELTGQFILLILAIGAFVLSAQIDMEFASEMEIFAGPRRYPRIILAIFILMNVILVVSTLFKAKTFSKQPDPSLSAPAAGKARALAVLIALIAFVVGLETIGYLILTAPLLIFVAMMNGARLSVPTVAVCFGLTISCLLIFRYGLNVVLPEGILGIDRIF